jgi:hypothetical protein
MSTTPLLHTLRGRLTASGTNAPELFPGDGPVILALPYYIDRALYESDFWTAEPGFYAEPARVTLYRSGLPPIAIERPFKDLSNF